MKPVAKRAALEQLLGTFDRQLKERFNDPLLAGGKCLLLGRHYAESRYVYFSLNPGFARSGAPLDPGSSGEMNVPFVNSVELCRQYVYLHNCQRFFLRYPTLGCWINSDVTSAFLVPWRTANAAQLYSLNRRTEGCVFHYARQLVTRIVDDHEAKLILAAGKSALTLLNDLGVPDRPIQPHSYLGPGGSYQWSRNESTIAGRPVTVLQIPHFSRANSPQKMHAFGLWLTNQLAAFPQ